ncbi:MAG TPA: type II toxin-antitoxin system VapC family toxin [Xanthobacteraceae bacterium]
MIIDTSAIIAILRDEPEAAFCARAIADAADRRVSAVNYVEAAVVIDASGDPIASRRVDDFFRTARIAIEAVTQVHAQIAREAYRDFGKGSGHPARLNFGDCFAYALAKSTGEPLLFKGDDFSHTDIISVSPR